MERKEGEEGMAKVTIAGARVSNGWTQQDLADRMGVSKETVIHWEKGRRKMKTAYFLMFCQITGFGPDDILLPLKSIENGRRSEKVDEKSA